jgi:hypothetical protein
MKRAMALRRGLANSKGRQSQAGQGLAPAGRRDSPAKARMRGKEATAMAPIRHSGFFPKHCG